MKDGSCGGQCHRPAALWRHSGGRGGRPGQYIYISGYICRSGKQFTIQFYAAWSVWWTVYCTVDRIYYGGQYISQLIVNISLDRICYPVQCMLLWTGYITVDSIYYSFKIILQWTVYITV